MVVDVAFLGLPQRFASSRQAGTLTRSVVTRWSASLRSGKRVCATRHLRELRGPLFDEPTLLRVGHRLKAGVCAKLAVDVVEVIAECLGGDAQLAGDGRGVAAFGEELQDATLLIGERLDWGVMCLVAGESNELSGDVDHAIEPLLVAPAMIDVAFQPHEEPASRALVVEDDRGDVNPNPASRPGAYLQVEIGDSAGRSLPATGGRFRAPRERAGAQRVARLEHFVDVAMEYLARRVAEQPLRGPVPGTDLAALSDGVRGVRGLLEQREQLRFEHRSSHDLPLEMLVLQPHVGQTGIRAQDARLSTRYERFIVAPGAPR